MEGLPPALVASAPSTAPPKTAPTARQLPTTSFSPAERGSSSGNTHAPGGCALECSSSQHLNALDDALCQHRRADIRQNPSKPAHVITPFLFSFSCSISTAAAAASMIFMRLALSSSVRIGEYTRAVIPGKLNIFGSLYTS